MELLDRMVILLILCGSSILFSIVAASIYSLTVHESLLFSISLPTLVISHLFDNSHYDRCAVIRYYGLDLHFPDDQ